MFLPLKSNPQAWKPASTLHFKKLGVGFSHVTCWDICCPASVWLVIFLIGTESTSTTLLPKIVSFGCISIFSHNILLQLLHRLQNIIANLALSLSSNLSRMLKHASVKLYAWLRIPLIIVQSFAFFQKCSTTWHVNKTCKTWLNLHYTEYNTSNTPLLWSEVRFWSKCSSFKPSKSATWPAKALVMSIFIQGPSK